MASISDSVWKRQTADAPVMSKNLFAFMVSFWTMLGIGVSAACAVSTQGHQFDLITYLVLGLVVPIVGIVIALNSDVPAFSLLGYMMVAIPFGLITGPLIALYTTASVVKVLVVTTGVVAVLGVVGAVIPDSLESWAGFLLGGLLVLLFGTFIVDIAGFFGLPISGAMTMLDWVGVVLFSGYVVYDLNRAMRVPWTHDNAIDCAVAVYLDFANIFLRLLDLIGVKKKD